MFLNNHPFSSFPYQRWSHSTRPAMLTCQQRTQEGALSSITWCVLVNMALTRTRPCWSCSMSWGFPLIPRTAKGSPHWTMLWKRAHTSCQSCYRVCRASRNLRWYAHVISSVYCKGCQFTGPYTSLFHSSSVEMCAKIALNTRLRHIHCANFLIGKGIFVQKNAFWLAYFYQHFPIQDSQTVCGM